MTAPNFGTIGAACRMIGGDRPIHPSTYYRGVRDGRYPPPEHPSPNISRVDLDKLAARLRAPAENDTAATFSSADRQMADRESAASDPVPVPKQKRHRAEAPHNAVT